MLVRFALFTQVVESLEKEITILRKLKHDRIVQYYGTERSESCVRIFMEYMEGVSDIVICLHNHNFITSTKNHIAYDVKV